jgi:hypothetical protein
MSDDYFLTRAERDRMQDAVDAVPRVTPGMFDDVCSSHAVADDVMRELAEALRVAWAYNEDEDEVRMAALAKYDRMTGGDDA